MEMFSCGGEAELSRDLKQMIRNPHVCCWWGREGCEWKSVKIILPQGITYVFWWHIVVNVPYVVFILLEKYANPICICCTYLTVYFIYGMASLQLLQSISTFVLMANRESSYQKYPRKRKQCDNSSILTSTQNFDVPFTLKWETVLSA